MKMETTRHKVRNLAKKGGNIYTFVTSVRFHTGKNFTHLSKHLNVKLASVARRKHKVWVILTAITFGRADAVIVWQAQGWDAVKDFRDDPSTDIGTFESLVAGPSDVW